MKHQERTTRYRAADIHNNLNKLKVKSLKILKRAVEDKENKHLAVLASFNVLSLLKEYE